LAGKRVLAQTLCRSVARLLVPWQNDAASALSPGMQRLRYIREWIRRRRIKRWVREITLAVVLTVAAAAFIAVAVWRGPQADVPYATARKPANN
jgi:hypothetical protein